MFVNDTLSNFIKLPYLVISVTGNLIIMILVCLSFIDDLAFTSQILHYHRLIIIVSQIPNIYWLATRDKNKIKQNKNNLYLTNDFFIMNHFLSFHGLTDQFWDVSIFLKN